MDRPLDHKPLTVDRKIKNNKRLQSIMKKAGEEPIRKQLPSRACRKKTSNDAEVKIDFQRINQNKTPTHERFADRLEWIKNHSDKPLTSTPILVPSKIFSQKDVQSCFGFDNASSDSENFDNVSLAPHISPIDKIKKIENTRRSPLTSSNKNVQFDSLLVRYGMLEEDKKNKLHVDSEGIHKTYAKKDKVVVFQSQENNVQKNSSKVHTQITQCKTRRLKSTNVNKSNELKNLKLLKNREKLNLERKIDKQTQEWIERKNIEFEGIIDFPLCVE